MSAPTLTPEQPVPGAQATHRYRADIDGVRAIAVLAVVAFHMKLPGAEAGFTGVDVFFVLSGYLITGNLASEGDRSGTIDLVRFWARRIRRLVPASTVAVVGTLLASLIFLPATAWNEVIRTSVASTLYYANFLFGADAADYFANDVEDNPLLHFWSLAVEEQFYLVWPLVIWLAVRWWRSRRGPIDSSLLVPIAVITAASFVLSLWLTNEVTPWSYYASPARAWEFGAGGLVALLARRRPVPAVLAPVGTWLGLGLIALGLVIIGPATPFPGVAALLPVVGTGLLCWCEPAPGSPGHRLLTMPPAVGMGKISYSFYLWHWPFLVIGQRALLERAFPVRLGLVLASLVAAIISYRLVENPIRTLPALGRRHLPNYGLAVALMVVGLGAAGLASLRADAALDDPLLRQLAEAPDDSGWVKDADCETNDVTELLERCSIGPADATATVLLLGDSHAEHWEPALTAITQADDHRLVVRFRGGCPGPYVDATLRATGRDVCQAMHAGTGELLDNLAPDVVVIGNSSTYLAAGNIGNGVDDPEAAWVDGMTALLDDLAARDLPVLWMGGTPRTENFPLECVARGGATAERIETCSPTIERAARFPRRMAAVEEPVLARYDNVITYDPVPAICESTEDGALCPIVADGIVRYRDESHLSAGFARTLAPELEPLIDELLAR